MVCWVSGANHKISVQNGIVMATFLDTGQYIAQSYDAKDDHGQWTLIAQSTHPSGLSSEGVSPLFVTEEENRPYRILTHNVLRSMETLEKTEDCGIIQLSGEDQGDQIRQLVSLQAARDYVHIEITCELANVETPKIEYVLSAFTFVPGHQDWVHAPCLKRATDNVMADRVFHGPAVVLQKNQAGVALVPDLDLINRRVVHATGARPIDGDRRFRIPQDPSQISMPVALDVDVN